ncbi:MAG: Hsp20/alpha crystallin family protein [Bacteroidia bacterium]
MKTLAKTNRSFFPALPSMTMFDDFLSGEIFNWNLDDLDTGNSFPAVNIKETDESYEMEVAAPGLNKDNFKVELDNNLLVISARQESSNEEKDNKGNYTRREFSYETFQRTFSLPEKMVEKEKISAKYRDGILHVSIPKVAEAKRMKMNKVIEITG